jgi:uncharacterized protein (DUF849 family)
LTDVTCRLNEHLREELTLSSFPLAVAPNGARRQKSDHPALPMTPGEIVDAAVAAFQSGASMVHVHARDRSGRHVLDADQYSDTIRLTRAALGERMIVQITTESVGRYSPEEQMAVVRNVRPEAVSIALRELAPDVAGEPMLCKFLEWLRQERILPQVILYGPAEVERLAALVRRGDVSFETLPVLYVLGRDAPPGRPEHLLPFHAAGAASFPEFMVCAFGQGEAACCACSILLGGGARVGFENNLQFPDGTLAPDNAALARRLADGVADFGYVPETAAAWRERNAAFF